MWVLNLVANTVSFLVCWKFPNHVHKKKSISKSNRKAKTFDIFGYKYLINVSNNQYGILLQLFIAILSIQFCRFFIFFQCVSSAFSFQTNLKISELDLYDVKRFYVTHSDNFFYLPRTSEFSIWADYTKDQILHNNHLAHSDGNLR